RRLGTLGQDPCPARRPVAQNHDVTILLHGFRSRTITSPRRAPARFRGHNAPTCLFAGRPTILHTPAPPDGPVAATPSRPRVVRWLLDLASGPVTTTSSPPRDTGRSRPGRRRTPAAPGRHRRWDRSEPT